MNEIIYVQDGIGQKVTPNGQLRNTSTDMDTNSIVVEDIEVAARSLKRKTTKRTSAGMDGIKPQAYYNDLIDDPASKHELLWALQDGSYRPSAYLITKIPKNSGGTRKISIPTARDRVAQKVAHRKLASLIDERKIFHKNSTGYRRGMNTMKTAQIAAEYLLNYKYVIRLDIRSFYDSINRERLLHEVKKTGLPEPYLGIIKQIIYAREIENGQIRFRKMGIPQGGPLSPLLANIYLNLLDWHLEKHHIPFVRYADDILLFTMTEKEANFFLEMVGRYCIKYLGVSINFEKTKITNSGTVPFLGFRFSPSRVEVDLSDLGQRLDLLWNDTVSRPRYFLNDLRKVDGFLKSKVLGLAAYYKNTANFSENAIPLFLSLIGELEAFLVHLGREEIESNEVFNIWVQLLKGSFVGIRDRLVSLSSNNA